MKLNKVPYVRGLVNKTVSKFTNDILDVKIKQRELVGKSDLNRRWIVSNKSKIKRRAK